MRDFAFALLCLVLLNNLSQRDRTEEIVYIPPAEVYAEHKKSVNVKDVRCMALNIYHEARGEPYIGQVAVAHVTLNRVNSGVYPNDVCSVVYQSKKRDCQFSWYCDGKSDTPKDKVRWYNSVRLAYDVLSGDTRDPTRGATHYFNPRKANPSWKNSFQVVAKLDNHVFLR